MFGRKKRIKSKEQEVRVTIYEDVVNSIFDECDRYDIDETGGRLLGFYRFNNNKLEIEVCGDIGPGPKASRSQTSFFQDGEYQEIIFRKMEAQHPEIEHLGNWHTHHVNGLDTLSSGDKSTYTRVVNHKNHNTDFFYALLVTSRNVGNKPRYNIKHFVVFRGKPFFYEIPDSHIKVVQKPAIWTGQRYNSSDNASINTDHTDNDAELKLREIRLKDKEILFELYSDLKPFMSKKIGSLYWRGRIDLIDDTSVEILVLESIEADDPNYIISLTGDNANNFCANQNYSNRTFDSARQAVRFFEGDLNKEILKKFREKEEKKCK